MIPQQWLARMLLLSGLLTALVFTSPASAQVYYYESNFIAPAYPLPAPNYVVYSPSFLAWRSAGYYGGNWGPYYYNPPALYGQISGTTIWPTQVQADPPVGWYTVTTWPGY